jgi:IS30 family transposase
MVMFNTRMRPEVIQPFWAALQAGGFISDAAEGVGTYRVKGRRWILAESGIRPRRGRHLKGRCLTLPSARRSLWVALAGSRCGVSPERWVAPRRLCRASCRATPIVAASIERPARTRWRGSERRPKPAKLWVNQRLREIVEDLLERRYSPEQIAGRLRVKFPADPEMWVSTETIYQSLYVTSRGALRRELTACLRTGLKLRHPGRTASAHNGPRDMVNIAQRPQEADDRAVPGNWEGV